MRVCDALFRVRSTLTSASFSIGGDLSVRRIGYGGMALSGPGGWGPPSDVTAARAALSRTAEIGIQLIDTADSYGPEVSENLIAEALHPYPEGVVIATKGGLIREGPWQMHPDGRPEHLRAACEGSLRRLRLDCIDLYQLHAIDPDVPLAESVGTLAELRAEGKIRHVGLSNVSLDQVEEARRLVPIASVQNRYSVAERSNEDAIVAYCAREGIAYLPWQPLAKGSLAKPHGGLRTIAARHGATPAQIALAWLLARSRALVAIPGTTSSAHVDENAGALLIELTPDDLAALEDYRLSRLDPRALARRFVPPRFRRIALSILRPRR